MRWVPNSAAGTARMDSRCVLPPLDMPGCFGRRKCKANLDDLDWDRPDLDCEPQQARGIPRNLRLDETMVGLCGLLLLLLVVLFGSRLRSSGLVFGRGCGVRT